MARKKKRPADADSVGQVEKIAPRCSISISVILVYPSLV